MKSLRLVTLLAAMLTLLAGCRPSLVTDENIDDVNDIIVSADNDYTLTRAELYDLLKQSKLMRGGGIVDEVTLKRFVDSIVTDTLTGFAADDIRLRDHITYYRTYRQMYCDALVERYFDQAVYSKIQVDSQEVMQFYEDRPDMFEQPTQAFVYHLLISPKGLRYGPDSLKYEDYEWEDVKKAAGTRIREIYENVDSPEAFKEAARLYSHDTTSGQRDGLIGWTAPGVYLDPFDSIAFSMDAGQFSEPFMDDHGWHMIMVEEIMPGGVPPMDERLYAAASQALYTMQANELGGKLIDSLRKEIRVEYNESLLDSNVFLMNDQQWLAVVSGVDTIDAALTHGRELTARNRYGVDNTTAEMKKEMLQDLLLHFTIVEAARDNGIAEIPEIKAGEAAIRHRYCKVVAGQSIRDPGWLPDDSLIAQYYQDHIDEYTVEKPYVIQHIIVQDSLLGDFIRSQAMSGVDFLDLAREYYPGDPEVRAELADLGAVGKGDVPDAILQAAARTFEGETTYPVKTEYGYHVVKVLEKNESKKLDRVRHKIVGILKDRHVVEVFENFRDNLYRRYNVRFHSKLHPMHLKPFDQRN